MFDYLPIITRGIASVGVCTIIDMHVTIDTLHRHSHVRVCTYVRADHLYGPATPGPFCVFRYPVDSNYETDEMIPGLPSSRVVLRKIDIDFLLM